MGYNPQQTRDEKGRWASGGASAGMLSGEEMEAIAIYRGEGYAEINGGLRAGTLGDGDPAIDGIDGIINKSKPEDFTAYRGGDEYMTQSILEGAGLDADADDVSSLVGVEFTDSGYVSTSTSEQTAENFATGGYSTMITVEAQNLGFVDMEKVFPDDFRSEAERVLPRGTTFRITGADIDVYSGGRQLMLTVEATREIDD